MVCELRPRDLDEGRKQKVDGGEDCMTRPSAAFRWWHYGSLRCTESSGTPSDEGRGWIKGVLPRAEAFASGHLAESAPKSVRSNRILVAEDLEINRELTRSILETAGHQVDIVTNGIEAVAAVQAESYDLVLMDIQMPQMDGITATREIRALDHPARKVPIIAMTGNVLPEQVRSFKEAGTNDHIGKPMRRNDLISKINKWLPRSGAVEETSKVATPASRPIFDQQAFDEFQNMMGRDQVAVWLTQLKEQLDSTFPDDKSGAVDREQLAGSAHAIVSQAALLGFFELTQLCSELEEACTSNKNLSLPLERARSASQTTRGTINAIAERLAN